MIVHLYIYRSFGIDRRSERIDKRSQMRWGVIANLPGQRRFSVHTVCNSEYLCDWTITGEMFSIKGVPGSVQSFMASWTDPRKSVGSGRPFFRAFSMAMR